jgi:hypothetical protein
MGYLERAALPPWETNVKELYMQRKVLLAALVALVALGGCAQRDPNLQVRGLNEFSRASGDYTLTLKTYELDATGHASLVGSEDPSLRRFVARSLAEKGYTLKTSGPARFAMEVHLLCADTRKASLGFLAEELRLPAEAVGAGYSEDIHYWLPDQGLGLGNPGQEAMGRRDSSSRSRSGATFTQSGDIDRGGTPLGDQDPAFCQGRVLVTVSPTGSGPVRQVFVDRTATGDCPAAPNCPIETCRAALERVLVYELDTRF